MTSNEMSDSINQQSNEVPTLLIRDSQNRDLLCFLEQVVPIQGTEYALLTPVDTPVCLFRLVEDGDPELIKSIENKDPVLEVADVVLQEHDLRLIRSAVTLTVSGELEEPEPDELEDKDFDDESETYELLVSFKLKDDEYGLYIPLDPFFVVGKLEDGQATVLEGEEFDTIQPLIEAELDERDY